MNAIDKLLYALRHDWVDNPYNLFMGVFGNENDMNNFRAILRRYEEGRCGYPEQYEEAAQRILDTYNLMESKKKQSIRLNESQLRQIVAESVMKMLNEDYIWNRSKFKTQGEEQKYFAKMNYEIESKAFEILKLLDEKRKSTVPYSAGASKKFHELYKHLFGFIFALQGVSNDGTLQTTPTRKYDDDWLQTQMWLADRYDKYGV